jgi:hypothetical protein
MLQDTNFKRFAAVTLLASFLPSVAVQAASLSSVQGNVQISRAGGAFQAVTGPTIINKGDVVRADVGSSAQVVYADGAIAAVSAGSSVVVAADPAAVLARTAFVDGPKKSKKATEAKPETQPEAPAQESVTQATEAATTSGTPGIGTAALVAGGLGLAAGTVLIVKKLKDDKKTATTPASP